MPTIRELFVGLGVKADQQKLDKFDKTLKSVKKGMLALTGIAVGLGVGMMKLADIQSGSIDKFAKQTLEQERQAKALNLTNKRYQEILGTFQLFNGDASDVSDVMNTLTDRSVDAAGGMKSMQDDFKLINMTVKEMKGLKPEAIFDLFVRKVAETTDVSKRNTAVVRLLGDDLGNKLLPLITEGAEGFRKYAKELHEFGVITDEAGIKNTRKFALANERLKLAQAGVAASIKLAIIPLLTNSTNRAVEFVKAFRPWLEGKMKRAAEGFQVGLKKADDVVKRLGSGSRVEGLKRLAGIVGSGLGAAALLKTWPVIAAIFAKVVAVGLVPLLVIGLKIAAVVVIFVALAAAIEDVIIFMRGGPSVTGRWLKAIQKFWAELRKGNATIDSIASTFEEAFDFMMILFGLFQKVSTAVWTRIFDVASFVFNEVLGVARVVFNSLKTIFGTIYDNVIAPLGRLAAAVFGKFFKFLKSELGFLLDNWNAVFGGIGKTVDNWIAKFKIGFSAIADFAIKQITRFTGFFDKRLKGTLGPFKKFIDGLTDEINNTDVPVGAGTLALTRVAGGNQAAVAGAMFEANSRGAGNVNVNQTNTNTTNITTGANMDERKLAKNIDENQRRNQSDQAKQLRFRASKER